MFLAAAPYFRTRFQSNDWAVTHFQSSIISVFTVTNLCVVLVLAKLQKNASYPKRIISSLFLNVVLFCILAFSTSSAFTSVSAEVYFGFLMVMVLGTSVATGTNQNGVFAYVAGFGRGEYMQAIMVGQGVAGVLPCVIQIVSVLAIPEKEDGTVDAAEEAPQSAFIYFIAASGVSATTLIAFYYLLRRRDSRVALKCFNDDEDQGPPGLAERKTVPLLTLFKKLYWFALAIFIGFVVTMIFPVFTSRIESVQDSPSSPRLYHPETFIPLAFLVWNTGDFLGRAAPAIRQLRIYRFPWLLLLIALARVVFLPLYLLCNIDGRGATVNSDVFYLIVVQLLFGFTNGYLNTCCLVGAPQSVAPEEKEATGGFMSLALVSGLTTGSLLSFTLANI